MPVDLPTTRGKVDYSVTQALERLQQGLSLLEQRLSAQRPPDMRGVQDEIQRLKSRVDVLAGQVKVLQQAP